MKKIKLVRFKAACAGEVQHLKFSDNYVSNSHWIAARSLFADVLPACGEEQLRALVPGQNLKAWQSDTTSVERLPDAKMTGRVPLVGRREYARTALRWEDGGGPGHDAACFLADDGARLWLRLGYVEAFGIVRVVGHGPDDPCAVVGSDADDVLVLSPCRPPACLQADRVLAKPRAKPKSPSRRAVEAVLPDPRDVAGAVDPRCESVDCEAPKLPGRLWCEEHSAPGPAPAAKADEEFI